MSNNKWQQLEEGLSGFFCSVAAVADGHELTFLRRLYKERLVVEVYVDGWIEGQWYKATAEGEPEHPQARFWRPYRTRPYKLSEYKSLKRVFGKKRADEMTALQTCAFMPYWNTPKSLVRHLKKHFPDLELKPAKQEDTL
ncbi:hypothetical protein [Marinobacter subterrani]|uniref:Uncharacterized protein n=1 Tax=Marinobacter subterrani TaxID=1658765 RepID=A0A0J7J6G5_9GAMM|nr:hypothetical protein [Marinobacter subterrani]KMQ73767.1 hypothetical protein Msub_20988 [Marinobacter subterrani]KMQ75350.1 hypothetical protein Msub_11552 [Marinobacter subterrani]KMQ76996.1 hypothetical protein Msub_13211 [Marinobacter subterrani]